MADEDLLIGGQTQAPPQGSSGISVPSDIIKVEVFAVFKEEFKAVKTVKKMGTFTIDEPSPDEYVVQEFTERSPRGIPPETVANFVWTQRVLQQAAIRTTGSAGEINYYPLDRFQRFTFKIGSVVGITL
jgi:hypothetical protein